MRHLTLITRYPIAAWAPCPPWCVEHWDNDAGVVPPQDQSRHHHGATRCVTYLPPGCVHVGHLARREVRVWAERLDTGGNVEVPTIVVDGLNADNPMSADDTERFARLLLDAVALTRGSSGGER